MKNKRTEIQSLGEFGLIERIRSKCTINDPSSILGIGDDAAVIDVGDRFILFSSDMMVEGIDFDLSYFPLQHLGYKAVVANISDIAAMNGIPKQVVVNIGLSNRFSVEAVDEIYEGILKACSVYKTDLVGGDTTSSNSGLILSISILGIIEKDKLVKRSTAGVNDIICVSGDLGASYMGLQVLLREKEVFLTNPDMQPDLESYNYVVRKHLKPEARTDMVYLLAEEKIIPSSMIDISDGLASDLMHICSQSGVGASLYADKIPVSKDARQTASEFKIDHLTAAMNGGEDYELLFTIRQNDFEKIKNIRDIHPVGHIQDKKSGINLVTGSNQVVPISAQGWNHFGMKHEG